MPDIGGFGRGLLKGALSATEKAADKVKDAAESASRKLSDDDPGATQVVSADPVVEKAPEATQVVETAEPDPPADEPSLDDEPEDRADESDVHALVDRFKQVLDERRPPAGPIVDPWATGFGTLLAEHPKIPKRVRGLISKLDHFGGVAYSSDEVAFDGDDVPWEKVIEVRTHLLLPYLVGDAVAQQVEGLPMPWFPGRKRLLDALGQALLTISIATAKDQLTRDELDLRIPAQIVYKASFGRKKELNAGLVSALVLFEPAVNESLIATARAKGIPVTAADEGMAANAEKRAAQLREKIATLEAELDRFKKRFGRKD